MCPKKGHYPKRGTNMPQIGLSCFSGGDSPKSCVQTEFEAERLKIAVFMTDRTFWDPKLPHFHRLFFGQKLEICTLSYFRHRYAKRTCEIGNVKNIRIRSYETSYFWCPEKGSVPQKGPKSVPYGIFQFSKWRYPEIMCTVQIWSRTVENCSIYDWPHMLGPKIAPFP